MYEHQFKHKSKIGYLVDKKAMLKRFLLCFVGMSFHALERCPRALLGWAFNTFGMLSFLLFFPGTMVVS